MRNIPGLAFLKVGNIFLQAMPFFKNECVLLHGLDPPTSKLPCYATDDKPDLQSINVNELLRRSYDWNERT